MRFDIDMRRLVPGFLNSTAWGGRVRGNRLNNQHRKNDLPDLDCYSIYSLCVHVGGHDAVVNLHLDTGHILGTRE